MKHGLDLFNDYLFEKAMVIGSEAERTGLEEDSFPSYPEWKATYLKEYHETHQTNVTPDEAVELFEVMLKEAEAELATVDFDEETCTMDDEVTQPLKLNRVRNKMTTENSNTSVAVKPAKPASTTSVSKPAAAKPAGPVVITKASKARDIFATMHAAGAPRKDVIASFMANADLSKSGASTYYQNFKKASEAVAPEATAEAAAPESEAEA